jgi:hypothetical protein
VLGVGQNVEDAPLGEALGDGGLQRGEGRNRQLAGRALEDRLALVSDDELAVVMIGAVHLLGGAGEPLLELLDEALGGRREAQSLAR